MEVNVDVDPFQDPPQDTSSENSDLFPDSSELSEDQLDEAERALGQLTHHAGMMFLRQHRCFCFQVLIIGTFARLLRWDRSGVIISREFDYCKEPDTLCEFFWRYNGASSSDRGFDDTVREATPDEDALFEAAIWQRLVEDAPFLAVPDGEYRKHLSPGEIATTKLQTYYAEGYVSAVEVGGETYLISRPLVTPVSIVSRGTRGCWAVSKSQNKVVFLKDTWRYKVKNMRQEGSIIADLNQGPDPVDCVPTFVLHGDIGGMLQFLCSGYCC